MYRRANFSLFSVDTVDQTLVCLVHLFVTTISFNYSKQAKLVLKINIVYSIKEFAKKGDEHKMKYD